MSGFLVDVRHFCQPAGVNIRNSRFGSAHRRLALVYCVEGGACFRSRPEREKDHQGRWRPQGPLNGLLVRPVPPLVGTHRRAELGWCPVHQSMRRSFRLVWRDSPTVARPPDTQPTHRLRLRSTSVPESGSTEEVTRREAAPGRLRRTATAGKVSAITKGNSGSVRRCF